MQAARSNPDWQVTLWPNRSDTWRGNTVFLGILMACFAFFAVMTVFAPNYVGSADLQMTVFAVIAAAMTIVMLGLALAFRKNHRDAAYREHISICDGTLTIEAMSPRGKAKHWEFPSYWTRVKTRTTRYVEHQLILAHASTAVAIGEFLTPEERLSLAAEIERALLRSSKASI